MKRALLLIDLQNDFLPGGALAVPGGDEVIPVANALVDGFDLVVATQDWHPRGHGSFASAHPGEKPGGVVKLAGLPQVLWPDHCVQGTPGAAFHPELNTAAIDEVVQKGTDPDIDSYSGFFDNGHRLATGLTALLRARGVTAVDVMGLALDYCVKFTALDAVREGFATAVRLDGCRAVNLQPGDGAAAVEEMRAAGVQIVERGGAA